MSLFCLHFNFSQERKNWQSGFNLYLKEGGSKRNSLQHVQNFAEIATVGGCYGGWGTENTSQCTQILLYLCTANLLYPLMCCQPPASREVVCQTESGSSMQGTTNNYVN